MAAFKNGERKGVRTGVMIIAMAKSCRCRGEGGRDYYASLKPTPGYNNIEIDTVPATIYVGAAPCGSARGGVFEPSATGLSWCRRIERAGLRDQMGFTDFVPKAASRKARRRWPVVTARPSPARAATGRRSKVWMRFQHHRPPATYIFRQLNDMRPGNRTGGDVELMKPAVAKLDRPT